MKFDPNKEKFGKGYGYFDRDRLRKTHIYKSESGVYAVQTKYIDRETLETKKITNFFTEQTMELVVAIYLEHFAFKGE